MRRAFRSLLILKIRYSYQRDGVYYYQRRIPRSLENRYPSKHVKLNLETTDASVALRKVSELNRRYEAEWSALLADPDASPKAAREQAKALLASYGLRPFDQDNDEAALDAFSAPLEEARIAYAEGCEHVYRDAQPEHFLGPVETAALELLTTPPSDRMCDALRFYLEEHGKGKQKKFTEYATATVDLFISAVGDKSLAALTRADARRFRDHELARGSKTASVRRRLTTLRAILNKYILENGDSLKRQEISLSNPFSSLTIQGEGEDADSGTPLSYADWRKLEALCRQRDDDIRWMTALQLGTGSRIGEVAGLRLDEIHLDGEVPHVEIKGNSFRQVKGDKVASSGRKAVKTYRAVPLVGLTLWAAKRIAETATPGQIAAFPRYIRNGEAKSGSASAAINKWLKLQGFSHTSHDFRHTIRDLLRAVECPEELALEVGGWAKETVGNKVYGHGHRMQQRQKWLAQALSEPSREVAKQPGFTTTAEAPETRA